MNSLFPVSLATVRGTRGENLHPNQHPKIPDYMNPDYLNATVEMNTTREDREFLLETSFIMEDMEFEENDLLSNYCNRANELED